MCYEFISWVVDRMNYGDEYSVEVPPNFDLKATPASSLNRLFQHEKPISRFNSSPDNSFFLDSLFTPLKYTRCYKIDRDRFIEIGEAFFRTPIIIRNQVSDLISFQFVLSAKRREFLGKRMNMHDLGPAIIVSAVPKTETTYRIPKTNKLLRHVILYTTLSNLMERMGESAGDYPGWLQEIFKGDLNIPRQRVLFLEEIHRDLFWPCFNLPVSGALLGHWLAAKFNELLCIGLQVLKNDQPLTNPHSEDLSIRSETKIRRARTVLNREYANPPSLPALARNLGISETQLKSGFKSMFGTTILQYCINKRIDAAKLLLNEDKHSISEIGDIIGYQDHSAFSRAFRRICGCSPRYWRQSQGVRSLSDLS